MKYRSYITLLFILLKFTQLHAQETNSHASGRVLSDKNESLAGVTVIIIHGLTQSKYVAVTRNEGYFHFFNLKPGGPYNILINSVGYESLNKTNLYNHLSSEHFSLNNSESRDFILQKKIVTPPKTIVTKYVLSTLEEMLPAIEFLRIYKSYIVAINKIESYNADNIQIAKHKYLLADCINLM